MATQLSGLDGHHFSLRSILKHPTSERVITRGISRATIHLVDGRDESAACGAELVPKFVDVATASPL